MFVVLLMDWEKYLRKLGMFNELVYGKYVFVIMIIGFNNEIMLLNDKFIVYNWVL